MARASLMKEETRATFRRGAPQRDGVTVTEQARNRKRRQRAFLAEQGLCQVTVTVPVERLEELREWELQARISHELQSVIADVTSPDWGGLS